jgi:hypothetical protein
MPRWSELTTPSRQLVMTTSRRSQATSPYEGTPEQFVVRLGCPWGGISVPAARRLLSCRLLVSVFHPSLSSPMAFSKSSSESNAR